MAGGGTTLDVCNSMGRRCLAYDLAPVRPEIGEHDVSNGFPQEASGCDLIFCDPPYHTMLARRYGESGVDAVPLTSWIGFLERLAGSALAALCPRRVVARLPPHHAEEDPPPGWGFL